MADSSCVANVLRNLSGFLPGMLNAELSFAPVHHRSSNFRVPDTVKRPDACSTARAYNACQVVSSSRTARLRRRTVSPAPYITAHRRARLP
jgi:hypothetical protein